MSATDPTVDDPGVVWVAANDRDSRRTVPAHVAASTESVVMLRGADGNVSWFVPNPADRSVMRIIPERAARLMQSALSGVDFSTEFATLDREVPSEALVETLDEAADHLDVYADQHVAPIQQIVEGSSFDSGDETPRVRPRADPIDRNSYEETIEELMRVRPGPRYAFEDIHEDENVVWLHPTNRIETNHAREGCVDNFGNESAVAAPLACSAEHEAICGFLDNHASTPDVFKCPISLFVMRDPVCMSDGHLYERRSWEKFIATTESPVRSPITREVVTGNPRPVLAMVHLVELWANILGFSAAIE